MAKALTVLVVDDEPPIRRFLRTSLTASGYRIVEAEDAAGALRALAAEKPDLVILDLGLPDKSGLELIGEIRKTSTVPILVLSARHDERSKVEALDLGADDYVGKPFGMAELMARLRAALRHAFQAQGELPVFVSGDLVGRPGAPPRHARRPRGQIVAQGIRPLASSRHACRQGADPPPPAARGLGAGASRRGAVSAGSSSAGCATSSNPTRPGRPIS